MHYTSQGIEQWAVADAWQGRSTAGVISPYFMPAGLGFDAGGNLYAAGPVIRTSQRNPSAPLPTVQLGAQTTVGLGTIVTRLNAYANTLRGLVYLDQNGNGKREATEGAFPQPLTANLVQAGNTTFSAVGPGGQLQAYASPGSYSLSLAHVPANYTVSQPSSAGTYTGTLTGISQVVTGLDFGVAPVPNQPDLRVTFVHGMARAGFPLSYYVSVENVGTTSPSGTITVTLDSHLDFITSTPAATHTGQTLTWTYTNLPPFGKLNFNILSSLPTNTVMGTALISTAAAPSPGI
ncbi:hypothetical protein ACFQT0_04160 [Hymenobacter humi]|uniref:SD-repeat containing protein B domain-containing protein n=1 Tax=Hymenobacter humi TaxID=1411620 RepID=A0ABW2U2L6_9BACT